MAAGFWSNWSQPVWDCRRGTVSGVRTSSLRACPPKLACTRVLCALYSGLCAGCGALAGARNAPCWTKRRSGLLKVSHPHLAVLCRTQKTFPAVPRNPFAGNVPLRSADAFAHPSYEHDSAPPTSALRALFTPPPRAQLLYRSCSNKHTYFVTVIGPHG